MGRAEGQYGVLSTVYRVRRVAETTHALASPPSGVTIRFMSTTSRADNSAVQRFDRYRSIIEVIAEQAAFEVDAVKQACRPEKPGFVTRVINELADQGWLIREAQAGTFCWNPSRGRFSAAKWLDERIFGTQVKVTPEHDRPRERLLASGAEELRTSELLAILVRAGRPGESAVTAGQKVARAFDGRLDALAAAGRGELKSISTAVDKTAYCQIMAGIELGRRVVSAAEAQPAAKIRSSEEAIDFCQKQFARLAMHSKQEEFHIVTLDTKNQVIDSHQITVGTLDASLVHPREVFRAALKDAASSIILVHNHPSGDPTPSAQDFEVTQRLTESGQTLGIDVLDHIVLGKGCAVSIRAMC